ncbi:Cysteine desulfurase [Anatilimnocola aggregata]|uniref:Cysteine desulfurase n=1 Tax=Anatilimnocola aggregata TaxID=2528021 RepID=A0A517YP25_9BACT|nr:cysteine desulfurase family protein [Anatilimnocola aggregata]QDU31972.1 Cysteine desulfurase [Anatilimnocola aggregata]
MNQHAAATIYLDNNATTPLDPRVLAAMNRAWQDYGANPASQHAPGRRARRAIEEAREALIAMLGGRTTGMAADRLIFTSGGTEANHLALNGLLSPQQPARGLAISALEHPSIQGTAEYLRQQGIPIERLPVRTNGMLDLATLPALFDRPLEQRPQLISLMLASNETGVLQPVAEVATLARTADVLVHTDAVQAIGKVPVSFGELGVAAMTLAAHKFHGPIGIGGLLVRHEVQLQPQMFGGFQQGSLRPGTESAALAIGFQCALELWQQERTERAQRMQQLRDQLQSTLQSELPTSVVIGQEVLRTPHTLCISFPPLERQALVMALDLAGIACSTGSACASGSSETSPTLVAMGLPAEVVGSAIRFSLGAFATAPEVSEAANRIIKTVKQLQRAN